MTSPNAAEIFHMSRRMTMKASDVYNEGVAVWEEDRKLKFMEDRGLRVRKVPFCHG